MAVRTLAQLARVSLAALIGAVSIGFIACAPTNDEFFDPDEARDPLVPLPSLSTAGSGGGPNTNVTDPPPV
ncbi:MAG: hypothetical protein RL033_880, partial [Pseudomonadota bacterium]